MKSVITLVSRSPKGPFQGLRRIQTPRTGNTPQARTCQNRGTLPNGGFPFGLPVQQSNRGDFPNGHAPHNGFRLFLLARCALS